MIQLPFISVIIIEYYSLPEVRSCINSLKKALGNIENEIIVTSNSVYDDLCQKEIEKDFQDATWQFNNENLGFAAAMNRGLVKASGNCLAIVNSDVEIIEGISSMIDFMGCNPEVGAAGPKIIDNDGNIQDNCRPYVSFQNLISRQAKRIILRRGNLLEKDFDYDAIQTVDWLAGAFIVVKREVYSKTKGLDPSYFLYAEDMDWCTRIRIAGYEIVYFPEMIVKYSGSRSARRFNRFTLIFIKSHFKYWRKFGFFYGYPLRKTKKYDKKSSFGD